MERRTLLRTIGATTIGIGLAGCGERSLSEKISTKFKLTQWLREGEEMGVQEANEHWRVSVSEIHNDDTIDLVAEKTVMDETGMNKEGIDPMYTFERRRVAVGDLENIENDFRIAYLANEEDEVYVGFSSTIYPDEVEEFAESLESTESA